MAPWQDLVFTLGSIVFFASLVPTALGTEKPPALTSVPTGALLILFSVAYASLGSDRVRDLHGANRFALALHRRTEACYQASARGRGSVHSKDQ